MVPLAVASPLAVAVSGGPDSVALAALLTRWCRARGFELHILTVDHGLRPEAAGEAAMVAEAWGARVLRWESAKPGSGLMEAARAARYRLLLEACRAAGAKQLFLAHHLDDQAETLLFRLARGSGWRGMAGMPRVGNRRGVALVRPLLGVPKARLVATAQAAGVAFVNDPSNENPQFSRVQMRAGLKALAAKGFDAAAIVQSCAPEAARRQAELVRYGAEGFCLLPGGAVEVEALLDDNHLAQLLVLVGQAEYPPELAAVAALRARGVGTLAGCRVQRRWAGWLVAREAVGPAEALSPGGEVYWDRRFAVRLEADWAGCTVAPLGQGAWRGRGAAVGWFADLPGAVRAAWPAVWQGGQVVAVAGVFGPAEVEWQPWRDPFAELFI